MDKKIAISQSNYIPWKGYFDFINSVDEFILYDDMQYTRRDWRNRNKIKTFAGTKWLTIPVDVKGRYYQKIKDTKINDNSWAKRHWRTIVHNYSKARYFKDYKAFFEKIYLNLNEEYLSQVNYRFIKSINSLLDIKTEITWSHDYNLIEGKTERLVDLCKQTCAKRYFSGQTATNYIDEKQFEKANIDLIWMNYSGYPEYNQLYSPFEHGVTILDLIFNEGPNAQNFMKSFGK